MGLGDSPVDAGNPIGPAATVHADGRRCDDGGADPVTGHSIVAADDLDAATAIASTCPVLSSGGSVEVRETFGVM